MKISLLITFSKIIKRVHWMGPPSEPFLINIFLLPPPSLSHTRTHTHLPTRTHTHARTHAYQHVRTCTHVLPIWILVILAAKDLLTFYHEIFRGLFYSCAAAAAVFIFAETKRGCVELFNFLFRLFLIRDGKIRPLTIWLHN